MVKYYVFTIINVHLKKKSKSIYGKNEKHKKEK